MLESVRARLTLWYIAVLGVVLVAFSAGVYVLLARSLYDRLDARLASAVDTTAATLKPFLEHSDHPSAIAWALHDLHFPNRTIAVLDASGNVLAQKTSPGGPVLRLPSSPFVALDRAGSYDLTESQPDADDSCRGVFRRIETPMRSGAAVVLATESLEPLEEQLDSLLAVLYVVVPVSLLLTGVGGWFLAHRSLAPLAAMSERARRITAENLNQRLPVVNPRDELGRLAFTFNDLLTRLNNSFSLRRQFMADASHALRTPLSAIRTTSSVMLERGERTNAEYRDALAIVEKQAQRLGRTVEDMFLLSRADAGQRALQKTSFYFDELLAETARAAAALASQRNVQLELRATREAPFHGDEDLLRQMVWNLLDNAIRHTPERGRIEIVLESHGKQYVVTITDTGAGVPPENQPHIFERFYRGRQGTGEGGAGLGLPIARWIAQAHYGRLELQRSDPTGSTFVVTLPHEPARS